MPFFFACLAYIAAAAAANLVIADQGVAATPYVAMTLVAVDLVARDVVHDRTRPGRDRVLVLGCLIAAGSLVALVSSPAAGRIALASCVAFLAAGTIDSLVYAAARRRPWVERVNASNVAAALVDSVVFFTVAGFALGGPVLVQAACKVGGGAAIAVLLAPLVARRSPRGHARGR